MDEVRQTVELVIEIIVLVLPIAAAVIAWYVRNYVKSEDALKKVEMITQQVTTWINLAEDLGKLGLLDDRLRQLGLSEEDLQLLGEGGKKLAVATLRSLAELEKLGFAVTEDEVRDLVQAEYQHIVGDIHEHRDLKDLVDLGLELLNDLAQSGIIPVLTEGDPSTLLLADLVAKKQDQPTTKDASHREALDLVNSRLGVQPPAEATTGRLADLAREAIREAQDMAARGKLTYSVARYAASWVLIRAPDEGLSPTEEQISSAVYDALAERATE